MGLRLRRSLTNLDFESDHIWVRLLTGLLRLAAWAELACPQPQPPLSCFCCHDTKMDYEETSYLQAVYATSQVRPILSFIWPPSAAQPRAHASS